MKQINRILQLLMGLSMILVTMGNAQVFEITPATAGEFGRTETPLRGIGVGNFPSGQITNAALHVNTNYMSTSTNYPGIDFGEVFRTDAPNAATYWKMYRNGNEIGRYWNGGTNNELNIGTIQTGSNPHLNFFAGNTQRMTILGNSGFAGIGNNLGTYTPVFFLDVQNQININFSGTSPINTLGIGYYLGGNMVFQTPGSRNTFLGVNTGTAWINGTDNVFVGENAGQNITTGDFNVFIGSNAGSANDVERFNTYVGNLSGTNMNGNQNSFFGHHSGFNSLAGNNNTFLGEHAGFGNASGATGSNNTFVGERAGEDYFSAHDNSIVGSLAGELLFSGNENAFLGNLAGRFNTLGSGNTFIGFRAGQNNISGNQITLIGHLTTAQATPAIQNATAIGASASVVTSNTMILGDQNVNVGIGLSGVAGGPTNKLEINAGSSNNSGLTFTTLTTANMPVGSSANSFLTVDAGGKVILKDLPGSGGSISSCGGGLTAVNFIPKISGTNSVCKSEGIYEQSSSPYEVGINQGTNNYSTAGTKYNLQLKGNMLIWGGGISIMNTASGIDRMFYRFGSGSTNDCLAIGPNAGPASLASGSSGNNSIYIGREAAKATTNNGYNVFVGDFAGATLASGNGATLIGYNAGVNCTSTNNNLTALGSNAGSNLVTGGYSNTFLGTYSGGSTMTTGEGNLLVGVNARVEEADGDDNIVIGNSAQVKNSVGATGNVSNTITIGNWGFANCNNCVTIASQSGSSFGEQQVGIGVANPTATISATGGASPSPGGLAKLYVSGWPNAGGAISQSNAGAVYATNFFIPSDMDLKDNIQPYTDANLILNALEAKSYNFKTNDYPSMNLPQGNQIGFLAEDIATVAPHLLKGFTSPAIYDSLGNVSNPQVEFLGVNYTGFIPVLFTAIKQQQSRIDALEATVAQCCAQPRMNDSESDKNAEIHLSNYAAIILNQNVPNPFKDKTEISFEIPAEVKNASILFYDHSGKILNTFEIIANGLNTLTVYGDDLSSGIYTYSLIVDGKPVQTKRMVKE